MIYFNSLDIMIRRKNQIIVLVDNPSTDNRNYVATINKNIESLGYTFSDELFSALSTSGKEELENFYLNLVPVLKNMRGANVVYSPMYPNFPKQIMEMDETELYLNALVHYWSYGSVLPVTEKNERLPLFNEGKIEVLNFGRTGDLLEILSNLVHSKTSLSVTDKEDIKYYIDTIYYHGVNLCDLQHKENAAYICGLLVGKLQYKDVGYILKSNMKTATDVLRLCTALSDGDVSLATNTKFRSFPRERRRLILHLLNSIEKIEEDMVLYKEQWKRLSEKLHPMEYQQQFPEVCEVFKKLRENEKILTFNGKVVKSIEDQEYDKTIDLLATRPGELARRLDFLLRTVDDKNKVITQFERIADQVATPVLWQIREHFLHRKDDQYRVFFPKGNMARSYNIPNELPEIEDGICKCVSKLCERALYKQYAKKSFMGRVYISEAYRNYVVPFSQRSAAKAAKAYTRGSRIPIDPQAKAIRGFIWWTNTMDGKRVDIDLSVSFFNEAWESMGYVDWTNLRHGCFNSCHSGDIVDGGDPKGKGVAEFIDVDIAAAIEQSVRYLVFNVYDYSGHRFNNLPNAMFGWMERQDVNSGEIFEPTTVVQKMDLTADTTQAIPVIFDCATKEFIWCDMAGGDYFGSQVGNTLSRTVATCYSVVHMNKPNLYDLIKMHIQARGVEVDNKEDADVIFDIDDGITPYDTEVFMAEYL